MRHTPYTGEVFGRTPGVCRTRAQALVEFALVVPVLIVLAMAVWDGGSVLREQVVLQQAARDGARVAATAYAPLVLPACAATSSPVSDAVVTSAGDGHSGTDD